MVGFGTWTIHTYCKSYTKRGLRWALSDVAGLFLSTRLKKVVGATFWKRCVNGETSFLLLEQTVLRIFLVDSWVAGEGMVPVTVVSLFNDYSR